MAIGSGATGDQSLASRIARILGSTEYFSSLDTPVLRRLAGAATLRSYAPEQVALLENDQCAGLYLVIAGWLKATRTSPQGREQVLRVVGPGDAFNAIGVLADTPNPATVIALEWSQVAIIQRDALVSLVREHPDVSWAMIEALSQRVMDLVSMVEDISLHSVETRLARFLLDTAQNDVILRQHWATQTEMAARLGTVVEVLNRALRGLESKHIIAVERRTIRILQRNQLLAVADRAR